MKKFRIPRKKKKYWKKRGLALVLPTKLRGEFIDALIKMMTVPNSMPLVDTLKKYPHNETNEDYTWEIQK